MKVPKPKTFTRANVVLQFGLGLLVLGASACNNRATHTSANTEVAESAGLSYSTIASDAQILGQAGMEYLQKGLSSSNQQDLRRVDSTTLRSALENYLMAEKNLSQALGQVRRLMRGLKGDSGVFHRQLGRGRFSHAVLEGWILDLRQGIQLAASKRSDIVVQLGERSRNPT